ncbi:HPP family-domain-containing protein, partial [Staphylotrichum tortipilum]
GAAAVLDFYAIDSPLAQPRNAVLGQLVSALTGISLCKLLSFAPHFPAVRWLGASLACACATALMALTGTVHPPAGATALMAVLDPDVAGLGWFLLLPLLLGCCLMQGVAVVVNNVQRRFPVYWWSPGEMGAYWKGRKGGVVTKGEKEGRPTAQGEKEVEEESSNEGSSTVRSAAASAVGDLEAGGRELATTSSVVSGRGGEIVIRRGRVQIPEGLGLMPEQILELEMLSERL